MAAMWSAMVWQPAHADDDPRATPAPLPRVYVQECAACHLAYPAGMLPAASWRRLMGGLDRHFGTDATLDAQDLARISRWLGDNAAPAARHPVPVPDDRITRTGWFVREHRKIEPATWALPSVRSASNCAACHTQADRGRFNEHDLRMPLGLSARQRAFWSE
jgi:hypothetical protein